MAYKIKSKKVKEKVIYEFDIGGHKVRGKSVAEVERKLDKMQRDEAILWGYKFPEMRRK